MMDVVRKFCRLFLRKDRTASFVPYVNTSYIGETVMF